MGCEAASMNRTSYTGSCDIPKTVLQVMLRIDGVGHCSSVLVRGLDPRLQQHVMVRWISTDARP